MERASTPMKVWVYAELNTLINIQDRLEPDTHLLDHLSVLTGNTVGHCITRDVCFVQVVLTICLTQLVMQAAGTASGLCSSKLNLIDRKTPLLPSAWLPSLHSLSSHTSCSRLKNGMPFWQPDYPDSWPETAKRQSHSPTTGADAGGMSSCWLVCSRKAGWPAADLQ